MDSLVEFHLESSDSSSINFDLDNGSKLIIPIEKKHSNKKTTSLIAPKREVTILSEMIPDNVSLVEHQSSGIDIYSKDNLVKCFTDNVRPLTKLKGKKSIKIIALDVFSLDKKLMNLLEMEIRLLRVLFARHNIAVTLHYGYAINSANYEAYKSDCFTLFEPKSFPISVSKLEEYNLALSLEDAGKNFKEDEHFFQASIDWLVDFKKQPE